MSIPLTERVKLSLHQKNNISIKRAAELKKTIRDYLEDKKHIKTGIDLQNSAKVNREKILNYLNSSKTDWQDWRWHLKNRISDPAVLAELFGIDEARCAAIKSVGEHYRWSISPYYASLMDTKNLTNDPIMRQSVPSIEEMDETGYRDPMAEEYSSPAPCVTRRYPDRLIINVTNQCAMYCRHCQRRRNINKIDRHQPHQNLAAALEYIRANNEIRDVLITGGDALLLSDSKIEWLLRELHKIDHLEIKRIGTRAIVTLPQRITQGLCAIIKKYPPIYINTQFNHPREITPESKQACDMLVAAGAVLGNQTVLLKGVNNNPHIMKKLNQELLKIRVRPYYIFHAKPVKGTRQFITTVDEGIAIMEKLRGYTSGLAVPTYIINAPNGYGKVPVLPTYVLGRDNGTVTLKTWENRMIKYSIKGRQIDNFNSIE